MVATPAKFNTKNARMKPGGSEVACRDRRGSISPDSTVSMRKAANSRVACLTPANIRAPMGDNRAQIITALPAVKPPTVHWTRKGSAKIKINWIGAEQPVGLRAKEVHDREEENQRIPDRYRGNQRQSDDPIGATPDDPGHRGEGRDRRQDRLAKAFILGIGGENASGQQFLEEPMPRHRYREVAASQQGPPARRDRPGPCALWRDPRRRRCRSARAKIRRARPRASTGAGLRTGRPGRLGANAQRSEDVVHETPAGEGRLEQVHPDERREEEPVVTVQAAQGEAHENERAGDETSPALTAQWAAPSVRVWFDLDVRMQKWCAERGTRPTSGRVSQPPLAKVATRAFEVRDRF